MVAENQQQRAQRLHELLCAGIGVGPQIDAVDYRWLMENDHLIPSQSRAEYVTRVVHFLRGNHGQPIPDVEKYNEGDRVEHWVGIPRNNCKVGDLYGIELKTLNFKATYLRFTTCSILTSARDRLIEADWEIPDRAPIQNYVHFPAHQEHIGQPISNPTRHRPPFITFNGENLSCNQPNHWNRLRLNLDGHELSIGVRGAGLGIWLNCQDTVDMCDYFSKFQRGTIIVFRHQRTGRRNNLLHTEVILPLNTSYLLQMLETNQMKMEIRVKNPRSPKNPGEAWEITRTTLNEILYDRDMVDGDKSLNWVCPPEIFRE
tara:strand:+ start:315 stop:1262 length:948 start_codon:yes stop_codon:yes gene_type:complete